MQFQLEAAVKQSDRLEEFIKERCGYLDTLHMQISKSKSHISHGLGEDRRLYSGPNPGVHKFYRISFSHGITWSEF